MAKRTNHPDQLGFFDEPAPDPAVGLTVGDRWLIVKSNHHSPEVGKIWLPIVEVVIRGFGQLNVTFARTTTPPLSMTDASSWAQWCLGLDDFFAVARKIQ